MSEDKSGPEGPATTADVDAIRVDERFDNDDTVFEPLFEDENVSDAALKGEEPSTEEKPADSESSDEKPPEKEKPEEAEKEPEEPEKPDEKDPDVAEKPEEKPDPNAPPPKGFVPIQALHESRENERSLKDHIASLERNLELLQAAPEKKVGTEKSEEPEMFKEFKVLSDAEWKELVAEDVEEALIYSRKLDEYNRYQSNKQREKQLEVAEMQRIESVIKDSVRLIADKVPGIYEDDGEVQKKLYDFGVDNGFDGQFLTVMSNPATRIIPVGQDGKPTGKEYPLGKGAASLVSMINKFHETISSNDPDKIRSEIEKDVETRLRSELSKELMAKIKNNEDVGSFRSISDAPGGSNEEPHMKKHYSEKDFFNMSEEEKRRALGG